MDKGIGVNSVLPTFATAIATSSQIKMMAAMDEISYIEAAKTVSATQR